MSQFIPQITAGSLKDKVVLVTGGANGIGASLVEYLCQQSAYVCFGDKAAAAGNELAAKIVAASASSPAQAVFYETDVTDYNSVLGLFDTALETYGHIDHVVAAAGITEIGNWFDPELTMEDIRKPATTKVIDVNLNGALYTARIASVFLKQNRPHGADRSITLIASIAGFKESPGLFVYQASKHGVIGLMRSLRLYFPKSGHKLRINTICPWMTHTGMVSGIQDAWFEAKLPVNTPRDVALVAAGLIVENKLNGKSMYVEGGRAWEIEDNIDRLEPQWLGEEPSKSLVKGQAVLADGSNWTK